MAGHELGEVDPRIDPFGVGVGEDAVVVEIPAQGVGDDDDDAFWGAGGGFGDVGGEAVEGLDAAGGGAFVEGAFEAVGAGHGGRYL